MSKIKLISQGEAYDELFTTADYIQTDDGVGIYPPYENFFKDSSGFTNIDDQNITEGFFNLNVPTGSLRGFFLISVADIPNGSYTIYFESSKELEEIDSVNTTITNTRFTKSSVKSLIFDFDITDGNSSFFRFKPYLTDLDIPIRINYTIVLKGYPNLQEWGGSTLQRSFVGDEKSISFNIKNFTHYTATNDNLLTLTNTDDNTIVEMTTSTTTTNPPALRLYDDVGTFNGATFLYNYETALYTISFDNNDIVLYENKTEIKRETSALSKILKTLFISTTEPSIDIVQIITNTEVSTGYGQGSTISIQPTCKLGLADAEIDLPKESRVQSSINRVVKELESESANATLHTQFIATKDRLAVSYDVISEENRKIIKDIEALQWQNNARLSYIFNEESGNLITKTVKATVTTGGNRVLRDKYFDTGLTIEMKE